MADSIKYVPINGGNLITDLKTHFSLVKTKRTVACAYGFVFIFILVTTFLAFSPSTNSSSPWFTNFFSTREKDGTYGSHYPSIFTNLFPKSSHQVLNFTTEAPHLVKDPQIGQNHTQNEEFHGKVEVLEEPLNQTSIFSKVSPIGRKNTQRNGVHYKVEVSEKPLNQSTVFSKETPIDEFNDKVGVLGKPLNQSALDSKASVNVSVPRSSKETQSKDFDGKVGVFKANQSKNSAKKSSFGDKGNGDLVKSLLNCDFFDGNWVTDESYPLYKPGSCSLIDEQFNCFHNGRPDSGYLKMKWKPKACSLPRLNGTHLLELLRGKRLVFVGDSLNRNMWESLICILKNSVKDQKKVYEENGRHRFRTEASSAFIFKEYNCRVEFFTSPFLVQQWEVADNKGGKKETLRLDLIGESADKYKDGDIIVFNTGHWWTHEKTSLGKDYYQEGSHVYSELNVVEAFRKALTTWGKWVDAHINRNKTFVLFRGYSASHFSGGQWNSGGACDSETEPIKNDKYLIPYPSKMRVVEQVLKGMKTQVSYLNITRMSDYRKDGHPSIYRKPGLTDKERRAQWRFQDCSHWCLPGVPDAWNELLYAEILLRQHLKQQKEKSYV